MKQKYNKAAVLGAGRWGSAMAIYLQRINFNVTIYAHSQINYDYIVEHKTSKYLSNYPFLPDIAVTNEINSAISGQDLLFIAIPTRFIRSELSKITTPPQIPVIGISKGIEISTGHNVPEIICEFFDPNLVLQLGGPCFPAGLLDNGAYAAETLAGPPKLTAELQMRLSSNSFRIYTSEDVKGVALLGAIKNILAIAAGVIDASKMNFEAKSALITRGLSEMAKIGKVLNIQPTTIYGLSGLGDLILTCYSGESSQNYKFGYLTAKHASVAEAIKQMDNKSVEGYHSAHAMHKIVTEKNIDAPICKAVYQYLYQGKPLKELIQQLFTRPLTSE